MVATYGEKLLAQAETHAKGRGHRRRLLFVFAPTALVVLLAVRGTWIARSAELAGDGTLSRLLDHSITLGYAAVLIMLPLLMAVRPGLHLAAAAATLITGPVAMPLIFGGGWKLWHQGFVSTACCLLILARLSSHPPTE